MNKFKISKEHLHMDLYTKKIKPKVFVNSAFLEKIKKDKICGDSVIIKDETYKQIEIDSFEELTQYMTEESKINLKFKDVFSDIVKGKPGSRLGIGMKITEIYIKKDDINEEINDANEEYIMEIAI